MEDKDIEQREQDLETLKRLVDKFTNTVPTDVLLTSLFEDGVEMNPATLKRMINNGIVTPPVKTVGRTNYYARQTKEDLIIADLVYNYVYGYGSDSKISNKFSNMAVARRLFELFKSVWLKDAEERNNNWTTMDELATFSDAINQIYVQEDQEENSKKVLFTVRLKNPANPDETIDFPNIEAMPAAESELDVVDVQRAVMAYGFFYCLLNGFKKGSVWENLTIFNDYESLNFKGVTAVEKKFYENNDKDKIAKFEEKLFAERLKPTGSPYHWSCNINNNYNEGKASVISSLYKLNKLMLLSIRDNSTRYRSNYETMVDKYNNNLELLKAFINDCKRKRGDDSPSFLDKLSKIEDIPYDALNGADKYLVDNYRELLQEEIRTEYELAEQKGDFIKRLVIIGGNTSVSNADVREACLGLKYVLRPLTRTTSAVDNLISAANMVKDITAFEGDHNDLSAWLYIIYTYASVGGYIERRVVEHIANMGLKLYDSEDLSEHDLDKDSYGKFSHVLRLAIESLVTDRYINVSLYSDYINRKQHSGEF